MIFCQTDRQMTIDIAIGKKIFYLIPFSQNSKSDLNKCWLIDMYEWHIFQAGVNLCVNLTHQWVLLKIRHSLGNHYKAGPRGGSPILDRRTNMKHCLKCQYLGKTPSHLLIMIRFIWWRKDTYFEIRFQKDQQICKTLNLKGLTRGIWLR